MTGWFDPGCEGRNFSAAMMLRQHFGRHSGHAVDRGPGSHHRTFSTIRCIDGFLDRLCGRPSAMGGSHLRDRRSACTRGAARHTQRQGADLRSDRSNPYPTRDAYARPHRNSPTPGAQGSHRSDRISFPFPQSPTGSTARGVFALVSAARGGVLPVARRDRPAATLHCICRVTGGSSASTCSSARTWTSRRCATSSALPHRCPRART